LKTYVNYITLQSFQIQSLQFQSLQFQSQPPNIYASVLTDAQTEQLLDAFYLFDMQKQVQYMDVIAHYQMLGWTVIRKNKYTRAHSKMDKSKQNTNTKTNNNKNNDLPSQKKSRSGRKGKISHFF
jgi:GTP-binding protein EngB required for normal cell division